ncbi:fibronectin type III domain-containing protein [Dyadobacter aurulentus]|uniref:fibronectin type III domain-containing protein n=1 Tax=Dyadobacter sp. UC 10 TaxID=2605428 RepID=UPI0011F31CDA|nr:fibronectin type III domain-containing protein [Dyadobacter sp. UC 10]KAA0990299.1 fibronectin type III domain-containing protein [Dyadobacter sp. UC 10]
MKKIFGKSWILVVLLLHACSVFGPVDPLPPALSTLELVYVNRSEITVRGTIESLVVKNDRQEKKSGKITEYGLVYGKTENLSVETSTVIRLDSTAENLPLTIENKISGLTADTDYFIALYARNEGGGIAYSEKLKVKTTTSPQERVNKKSIKVARGNYIDLDAGNVSSNESKLADVSLDIFSISGRGTVLAFNALNGLIIKDMGVVNFDELIYPALLKVYDYDAKGVSVLVRAESNNTVLVFKTLEGRYGRLRIESAALDGIVISLVTYDN